MKIKNKTAHQNLKPETGLGGFTLVELIVVITILAILWTIAFISLQWYARDARDSVRVADLKSIEKWLEFVLLWGSQLPKPEEPINIVASGTTIYYQWYAWETVLWKISVHWKGKDPLDDLHYTYITDTNLRNYQLLGLLEWSDVVSYDSNILKQTNAIDYTDRYPTTRWKKLWVLTDENNTPVQEISELQSSWSLDIVNTSSVFKTYFGDWIFASWTWTVLYRLEEVASVWWRECSWFDDFIYCLYPSWTSLDTNCEEPDILIWKQIWAGCNSTLWTWIERWKKDDWTNWTIESTSGCYKNHQGTNDVTDCVIGSSEMASNTKSNTWFTWTNSNWDSAPANIWWKLYTWDNANTTACWNWYHLPSDEEWEYAEEYLFDWTEDLSGCRTIDDWECDTVWWKLHTTTNKIDNLAEKLQLPLAGYRSTDGSTFGYRGYYTYLWSSSLNVSNARGRLLRRNYSTVLRGSRSTSYGFSVRCLKD